MIQRSSYLLYIAIFIFACVIICASTFSLWFLRGVVGSQQGVLEVGNRGTLLAHAGGSDKAAAMINSYIGFSSSSFSRLVYVQDRLWEYVVGIPSIKNQGSVGQLLTGAGWSTSRLGWIVVGRRALHTPSDKDSSMKAQRNISLLSGLRSELSAIFVQHLSANPLFFVRTIPGFKSIENGVAMYGDSKKDALHVIVSYNGSKFLENRMRKLPADNQTVSDLEVSIQSGLFQLLPKEFLSVIDTSLATSFHFTKTSPGLLAGVSSNDHIGILLRDDDIAIGVNGNPGQFVENVVKDIQSEQGARHPQRKGFLLPDKTLGHEYVPSSPQISFEKTEDSNCETVIGYDEKFFMCKDSTNLVAVATSLNAAEHLMQSMKTSDQEIQGSVAGDILKHVIPEQIFGKILFAGNESGMNIWAVY